MTENATQPIDRSLFQPTKFQLLFRRIPNITYFCQSVDLPGLSIPTLIQPTPFVNIPRPGSKLTYNDLAIRFVVDEALITWFEIHDWIRSAAPAESFTEYSNTLATKGQLGFPEADAVLSVFNNQNVEQMRFQFHGCFPVSIENINLDSSKSAEDTVICEASFKFAYFDRTPQQASPTNT